MMLPMKRSEVFKILSDIFCQDDIKSKMELNAIEMSESPTEPYDIDFHWETTGKLVSYLHFINPPKDCVDGKYYFEYRVQRTQKTGTIAIDSAGTIRVYSDDLNSFIYDTIKNNVNRLADYVKKLTRTYHEQVADTIINIVKTYCDTLMNKYASIFDQLDTSVFNGCCTDFLIRSINEPERNFMFFVVNDLDKHNIKDNEIRVRISKPDGWIWTPLFIRPAIGDITIYIVQPVFTDIFGVKDVLRLARLISERTGFAISVIDGGSTREQHVAKYIKSLLQKHEVLDEVLDTVKQDSTTAKVDNENNKSSTSIFDDVIDKKIARFCDVAERSAYYTTKEYQFSNICKQLTLWQQGIFNVIYSAIYCTLAESKYTGAAYELERHFIRLVGTDKDQGFHVYFRLDDIHKDLPRFDIEFNQSDTFVRIQEGDWTKTCVLLNQNADHAKHVRVYTQTIKYLRDTYKTIVSHVASKIVLMDALS